MASQGFGSWRHLAERFFGALSPAGPPPGDDAWALGLMVPGEQVLWRRMSGPDRRHAVGVARDALVLLGPSDPPSEIAPAALLHDVGKVESSFGTFARAGVTVAAMVFGRRRLQQWGDDAKATDRPSLRARVGRYLTHDRLGAQLLEDAGSRDLTVAWAGQHHLPPEDWTVDARVGAALKAADGD
jgi:hypothetical protein